MEKRLTIISLLMVMTVAVQAQKKDVTVLAESSGIWVPRPTATFIKDIKKTAAIWERTEKDDWYEPDGRLENVPTVKNPGADALFVDMLNVEGNAYTPMPWRLTEEGDETVLHCYLRMPADIVGRFWLTDEEGGILDKETGISYRARRTEPSCYEKLFTIRGKEGDILDFKIFFPKLPESVRDVAIYGVPNWGLRGRNVTLNRVHIAIGTFTPYDTIPKFHKPTQIVEAKDYDKDNFYTWSEYTDVHLIKPIPDGTMAMWLTPEATYVAISTEMNWRREYFGRGVNCMLIDKLGHQYKCKDVLDYPDDTLFWVQGYSGDYFATVKVFEPIPLSLETITYIVPEGEPFMANFANWSGVVKADLSIKELRQNQRLFEYFPRKIVK